MKTFYIILFISILCLKNLFAFSNTVVSIDSNGIGDDNSGYNTNLPLKILLGWNKINVDNSGNVDFLSSANFTSVWGEHENSGYSDWDLFHKDIAGNLEYISMIDSLLSFKRYGDAKEFAVFNDLLIEVRDELDSQDGRQKIFYRKIGDSPPEELEILEDYDQYRYLSVNGTRNTAYMTVSAKDLDTENSKFEIVRAVFTYNESLQTWIYTPGTITVITLDEDCEFPSISDDGSRLTYASNSKIFYFDDNSGLTTEISSGIESVVNSEGTYITLFNAGVIYQYNINTGVIKNYGNGGHGHGLMTSADGRFVVFYSNATDGIVDDFNNSAGSFQVYLLDTYSGDIELITTDNQGDDSANCYTPSISPNGRYITFSTKSEAFTKVENTVIQAILHDRGSDYTNHKPYALDYQLSIQIGVDTNIVLNGEDEDGDLLEYKILSDTTLGTLSKSSTDDWFSAEDFPLAYHSSTEGTDTFSYQIKDSKGMISESITVDLTVGDYLNGFVSLVSDTAPTDAPFRETDNVAMSANGEWVAYTSFNIGVKLYLKNLLTEEIVLLPSTSGETPSLHPKISINANAMIYVERSNEDTAYLVYWCKINENGPDLGNIKSIAQTTNQSISISGDGSKVVFDTAGTSAKDIILWEPETDSQTTIASNVTGYPVISGNGNCIAYFNGNDIIAHFASADGLFADSTKLFSITDSDGNLSDISISMNGQFASYHSGTKLKILDLTSGTITTIQEESVRADLSVNNSQLSPGAGYIYLTTSSDDAYRYDINGASYLSNSLGSESYAGVLSPDGTKVCFASNAQLADDTDDHRDVFIVDFANSVANEKPISASVDLGTYDLDEDSLTPIEIVLSASDDHDNDLTYMIASQPIHGTVAFQYADGLPWLIYNVTELNFNGTDSFTFRAVDSSGLHSEEATINITITPVNDPPEFTLGSDIVVDEDFQGTETVSSTPGSIPDDETEQVVNYSLSPSSVDFATVNIDPVTGEISVVTVADGNGTQLFTVTANDAQQENNTYQQNFLLTINPVDEEIPRETNTLNSQTLIEGESFAPFDLDNYFEDVDGNDLDFSRSGIVNLIIDIDNNNIVSVSAPEGWVGSEEITFTATDKTDQEKYTSETILFKINVQRTFDLKEGWNLISFPLEIDTVRNSDIFDKNTGTIWFWEEGEYKTVESLLDIVSGYGYWYYSKTEQNLDFEGQFPDSASIPLEDGWNMIGPIGTGNDMNIPERFRNNFIWFWDATETVYKNIAYGNLDKFESKKGYWLNNINNEVAIELELLE